MHKGNHSLRCPLDNFKINWNSNNFQSFASKKRLRFAADLPALESVKYLFDWEDWAKSRDYGALFKDLFYSKVDLPDEERWSFHRPLGKGSYGAVAVFSLINDEGDVIDTVAIKSAPQQDHHAVEGRSELSTEAAIMAHTNDLNCNSILYLRHFKYYAEANQWRFFLEHCEYGDLECLRIRYKAWQALSLASFLPPCGGGTIFRNLGMLNFGTHIYQGYLLHCDLKTQNVFIGSKHGQSGKLPEYGVPMISDFGLARLETRIDRAHNIAKRLQRGTTVWYPPEIRYKKTNESFARGITPDGLHSVLPSANVWAIGAILWTLVTGKEIELLDHGVDLILRGREPAENGGHIIMPIHTRKAPEYTSTLLELVRDCLVLEPDQRPSAGELCDRARAGLQVQVKHEKQQFDANPEAATTRGKVFVERNNIQGASIGDANFDLDAYFWSRFIRDTLFLPEEWGPLFPGTAPVKLSMPGSWPAAFENRWQRNVEAANNRKSDALGPDTDVGGKKMPKQMVAEAETSPWAIFPEHRPFEDRSAFATSKLQGAAVLRQPFDFRLPSVAPLHIHQSIPSNNPGAIQPIAIVRSPNRAVQPSRRRAIRPKSSEFSNVE